MKIYKNLLSFVIVAVCLSCFTACEDDFLAKYPDNKIALDLFFQNEEQIEQGINAVYQDLKGVIGAEYAMAEMRTDNTTFVFSPTDRGGVYKEYYATFTDLTDGWANTGKYYSNYSLIDKANQVIARIDDIEFTDENHKKDLNGQVHFLRAYAYYDLLRFYGEVPIYTEPVKNYEQAFKQRSSIADVKAQVMADIKVAEDGIKKVSERSGSDLGRATLGAVQMLKGMMYFSDKNYKEAEAIFKSIKGYDLVGTVDQLWSYDNKNNIESIFEVQYEQGNEKGFSNGWFYEFLPHVEDISLVSPGVKAERHHGHTQLNIPTPDLLACYEEGDKRYDASFHFIPIEWMVVKDYSVDQIPHCWKYWASHEVRNDVGTNWPIWRYAEVLLNIAECRNEQNQPGEALEYINLVRNRAGLEDAPDGDQEHVRQVLDKERRCEFVFENKRWFDLIRSGNAVKVLNDFGERVKANPGAYYYSQGAKPITSAYKVTKERLLYPIPQRGRDINKELTQNDGY